MKLKYALILTAALLTVGCSNIYKAKAPLSNIMIEDVCRKIESNEDIIILDVRTEQEYNGELGHLRNSILIPVTELKSKISEIEKHKNKEIIVYCRSGNRSMKASEILVAAGFKNVMNMTGGMRAWNGADEASVPCKTELLIKDVK